MGLSLIHLFFVVCHFNAWRRTVLLFTLECEKLILLRLRWPGHAAACPALGQLERIVSSNVLLFNLLSC